MNKIEDLLKFGEDFCFQIKNDLKIFQQKHQNLKKPQDLDSTTKIIFFFLLSVRIILSRLKSQISFENSKKFYIGVLETQNDLIPSDSTIYNFILEYLERYNQNSVFNSIPFSIIKSEDISKLYEEFLIFSFQPDKKINNRVRKEAGAYYTDAIIVEKMLDLSFSSKRIESYLDQPKTGSFPPSSTGQPITICDPSMGTGCFLLPAFLRLLQIYSRSPNNIPNDISNEIFNEISNDKTKKTLTDSIFIHCLYGIDINPLAVLLTRDLLVLLALDQFSSKVVISTERVIFWLKTLSLNIMCGDALISPFGRPVPSKSTNTFLREHIDQIRQLYFQRLEFQSASFDSHKSANFHYTKPFDYDNYGEFNKEGDHQFSWILSFPEIFLNPSSDKIWKETPGFSIILNNPPWEMAQLNDKEFFTHYNNSYPILSRNEKNRFKAEKLADSKLLALYKGYKAKIKRRNQFWNENFYLQGEQKYNLYKLFLERIYDLVAPAGTVSIIVPAGILGEYRANLLRIKLFSSFSVSHILQLYTGKYFFPSIVSGLPLAILSFFKTDPDSSNNSQSICFCGNIQKPLDLKNLPNQMFLSLSFLQSITSRSSIVIPLLNGPDEVKILQQLLIFPKLSSGWNIDARRELNRTDDEKNGVIGLIHTSYPVLEGKHLVQFGYSLENARFYVQDPKNYHKYKPYSAFERIIWRNVSNIRLRRRMFCTIIPPNIATANSLNYLVPKELLSHTHEELLYLCGMLGSLVAEFFLRLFSTNNNLNQYLILNLPVPFYDPGNNLHQRLVQVLSNFIPIANQWARRMVKLGKQSAEKQKLEREYWSQMREIDALACRIYGISVANFNIVKKKFPKIEPDYFTGFPKW